VEEIDSTNLAQRIKEGNHNAFHSFFNLHYERIYRFLISKGIRRETAEDLIQQAFLYIWEHRTKIDPNKSLRAYLFSIAYSRMLNYIRDNKKFKDSEFPESNEATLLTPRDSVQHKELLKAVKNAIEEMPQKRSMVFEMCFMQDFTYKETAKAMGVSVKTVENHMGLAFKDLRAALEAYTTDKP
jgi:RNA polymerase sigma-70 factor (ECF subfamily)